MRLSDSRYEDIKQDIVKMYVDNNITTIPIDVYNLSENLGYKLKPYSSLGVEKAKKISEINDDGFNRIEEGKVVIYYNDEKIEGRIRFTIMHEIAHVIRQHKQYSELAETEANWYAAYALCHPPIVDKLQITNYENLITKFNITNSCAYNSMNRYISWKKRNVPLSEYEKVLIKQFGF
jgi:Predicted Zn peptidase